MGNRDTRRTLTRRLQYQLMSANSSAVIPVVDRVSVGELRVGADRPKWRSDIAQGRSATNSLNTVKYVVRRGSGFLRARGIHPAVRGKTAFNTYVGLSSNQAKDSHNIDDNPVVISARGTANMRIRKKIREENSSWSGLTFLGELRETIHMIRNPAATMRKRLGLYIDRHKRHRNKPGYGRTLADSWLEFSFGVSPLIGDISSAAEALLRYEEPRLKRLTVNADDIRQTANGYYTNGVGGLNIVANYTNVAYESAQVRFTAGYQRQVTRDWGPVNNLIQYGGFRLDEIIPTAWELIPWSFLIDYFANIGDVIAAATVSTSNVKWWSRTTVLESHLVRAGLKLTNYDPSWLVIDDVVEPYLVAKTTRIVRDSLAPGIPPVTLELPGLPRQFLNMGALIAASKLR